MMKKLSILLFAILSIASLDAQNINVKVMTYNLRFGEIASMAQIGEYIASKTPDMVALQECDWATFREKAPLQNGVKFINELASTTGMFGVYGKAIDYRKGYYGIGLLSAYPIIKSERIYLPHKPNTEQRVMLLTVLELPENKTITFVSTHLEVSTPEARIEQAEFICDYFKDYEGTVILAGDLNAEPDSEEIQRFFNAGWKSITNNEKTFSVKKPSIKIDYILYLSDKSCELLNTMVCVDSALSDHFPVISEISIDL